jgi:hypothetical protein
VTGVVSLVVVVLIEDFVASKLPPGHKGWFIALKLAAALLIVIGRVLDSRAAKARAKHIE